MHAVDGVSFDIGAGETLGLVGESGCGKSTTGRCILRLIEPTLGRGLVRGQRRAGSWAASALRALRRDMQIIFQDPFASLNPRMTVGAIIGEALTIHKLAKSRQRVRATGSSQLLETVGLQADHMRRYPARILRRPAPAHRHRPRARRRAQADRLRRAGVGARRVDPGAGDQPAGGPAGEVRPHLPVHRPRSVGGRAHQRRGWR